MDITLLSIGRFRSRSEEQGIFHSYIKRTPWSITLREHEIKARLPEDKLKLKEAEWFLSSIPDGAYVVALDEKGKSLDSVVFANQIQQLQEQAVRQLVFIIGGAYGLDKSVRVRADKVLSFGEMTWPHLFVRMMLAEQLYRASTIINRHPYHKV